MDDREKCTSLLREKIDEMGFAEGPEIASKLVEYMEGILDRNERVNLTAIKDRDEFLIKHYLDSFEAALLPEFKSAYRIIDVGTGGGFPGVPLAALCPEKEFILADSLAKRLKIIDALAEKCHIENISTVHGRAEDLGRKPEFRDSFDLCVSRAVASLPVLLEYCLPFVKVGGTLIAYKGPEGREEIESSRSALEKLGGKVDRIVDCSVGELNHILIVIKKETPTPKAYPRKAGTPSKMPL